MLEYSIVQYSILYSILYSMLYSILYSILYSGLLRLRGRSKVGCVEPLCQHVGTAGPVPLRNVVPFVYPIVSIFGSGKWNSLEKAGDYFWKNAKNGFVRGRQKVGRKVIRRLLEGR